MPCGPPVFFFFLERKSWRSRHDLAATDLVLLSVHSFSRLPECVSACSACLRAVRVFVSLYVRLCDVECVYS